MRPTHRTHLLSLLAAWALALPASAQFFPGPSLIVSNGRPEAIAAGDLDGDGRRDLVATAAEVDQVVIHRSLGQGQYTFPFPMFVGGRLSALAIADLDLNGENDIVGVDGDLGDLVLVYQFSEAPQLWQQIKLPGQDEPQHLVVKDLDGDLYPEILVSYLGADEIGFYANDAGTIQFPQRHPVGDGPRDLAVWESAAGRRQLLVESGVLSRNVAVFDENWNALQRLALGNPVSLDLLDWDGVGPLDLFVVDAGGFARVFEGRDSGDFASSATWPIEAGATAVLALEDAGANPGAVILEAVYNRVTLYSKQGTTGALQASYFLGDSVERLLWEDTDEDGNKELLVPLPEEDRIAVYQRDGTGLEGFETTITGAFPWRLLAQEAAAGLPARAGVLCLVDDELWIYELGSSVPQLSRILQGPPRSRNFRWMDLNEDTIPDVLILGEEGTLRYFEGQGNGFASPVDIAIGITPQDLEPIHLDPAGPIDLAVSDLDAGRVWLLEGDGAGGLALHDSLVVPEAPRTIRVSDLDQDGRDDIVVAGDVDDVLLYFSDPSGSYLQVGHLVGQEPRGLTIGNFNGDIYPDIAVGIAGESKYTVFASLAARFYGLSVDGEFSPEGTQVVLSHDISGDGLDDLVMTSTATTGIAFHIATGGGRFTIPGRIRCSSFPTDIAAVDVDGDGAEDLLVLDGLGSIAVHVGRSVSEPSPIEGGPLVGSDPAGPRLQPALDIVAEPNPSASSFLLRLGGDAAEPGRLRIFDLRGRLVAQPEIEQLGPGAYAARWAGSDENGAAVAAGRYYAEWSSGGRRAVAPLTRIVR